MNILDTKKLITVFLMLATAVSSLGLVYINLGASSATPQIADNSSLGAGEGGSGPAQNAFVNPGLNSPVPPEFLAYENPSSATASDTDSNITHAILSTLGERIADANPNGPTAQTDGTLSINPPDLQDVSAAIATAKAVQNFSLPSWDKDASFSPRVIEDPSRQDFDNYNTALSNALSKTTGADVASAFQTSVDVTKLPAVEKSIQQGIVDLKSIAVPKPLVELHKSLVLLAAYEHSAVAAASSDMINDPIKVSLILQGYQNRYTAAIQNVQTQLDRARATVGMLFPVDNPSLFERLAENTVLPHRAYAFFGMVVLDPSNLVENTTQVTKTIWEQLQDVLISFLTNTVLRELTSEVITWIRGGGKPAFITNWRNFLETSAQSAAGLAINTLAANTCKQFGAKVQKNLQDLYDVVGVPRSGTCYLDQLVRNTTYFFNSFSYGGWRAYAASVLPSGNYYGSYFESAQIVSAEVAKAQDATKTEASANKGFLSSRICTNQVKSTAYQDPGSPGSVGSLPLQSIQIPSSLLVPGPGGAVQAPTNTSLSAAKQNANYVGSHCDNNTGNCTVYTCASDKDWKSTTPGTAIASQLDIALGSPTNRIAAAAKGSLLAIVSALIDSALNHLIQAGENGILGIGSGSSGGGGGGGGGSSGGGGGAGSIGSPAGSVNNDITQAIQPFRAQLQTIVDNDNQWLALEPQVVSSLSQVASSCASLATSTQAKVDVLHAAIPATQAEIATTTAVTAQLNTLQDQITNATDATQQANLFSQLSALFNSNSISDLITGAAARYNALVALQQELQAALASPPASCPATL